MPAPTCSRQVQQVLRPAAQRTPSRIQARLRRLAEQLAPRASAEPACFWMGSACVDGDLVSSLLPEAPAAVTHHTDSIGKQFQPCISQVTSRGALCCAGQGKKGALCSLTSLASLRAASQCAGAPRPGRLPRTAGEAVQLPLPMYIVVGAPWGTPCESPEELCACVQSTGRRRHHHFWLAFLCQKKACVMDGVAIWYQVLDVVQEYKTREPSCSD